MTRESDAVASLVTRLRRLNLVEAAEALSEACRPRPVDTLQALLLGRFSVGKSTIINAFLGYPVLPGGLAPTTGVVCELAFGPPGAVILFNDGRSETFSGPESVASSLALDPADSSRLVRLESISRVEVTLPLRLLQGGLRVTDSPGLDEDEVRTRRATDYLDRADVVLFVVAADQLMGEIERHFLLNELMPRQPGALAIVVNFWDRIPAAERPALEARIGSVVGELFPYFPPPVFRISALQALRSRWRGTGGFESTGVPELEDWLESRCYSREEIRSRADAGRLQFRLAACQRVLQTEQAEATRSLEADSVNLNQARQLLEGCASAKARALDALTGSAASLTNTLTQRMSMAESRFRSRIEQQLKQAPGSSLIPVRTELEAWWKQGLQLAAAESGAALNTVRGLLKQGGIDSALPPLQCDLPAPVPPLLESERGGKTTFSGILEAVSPRAASQASAWIEKASRVAARMDPQQNHEARSLMEGLQEAFSLASFQLRDAVKNWQTAARDSIVAAASGRSALLQAKLEEEEEKLRITRGRVRELQETAAVLETIRRPVR